MILSKVSFHTDSEETPFLAKCNHHSRSLLSRDKKNANSSSTRSLRRSKTKKQIKEKHTGLFRLHPFLSAGAEIYLVQRNWFQDWPRFLHDDLRAHNHSSVNFSAPEIFFAVNVRARLESSKRSPFNKYLKYRF